MPANVEWLRKLLRFYFGAFHGTRVTGRENLPPPGPVLFAANHQSYYDPILIAAEQDLPIKYMAWDALFRNRFFGGFLRNWGAFGVDPAGGDSSGFRECLRLLQAGDRVLIFPEGGRSYDGELLPLREGVARLAIHAEVPIVPVRITGADGAWPRGDFAPRPFFRIDVQFLPALHPHAARAAPARRAESARLMEAPRLALEGKP